MNSCLRCLFGIYFIFLLLCSTVFAEEYYVSESSGSDSYSGTSTEKPWKTLAKVSERTFSPGDAIYLKRGDTWQESLTVSSSGVAGSPITYGTYGSGNNPLIKLSETCVDWTLVTSGSGKVWQGTSPFTKTPWGAVHKGSRVPQYVDWTMDLADIANGYFFKAGKEYNFYFRWDEGNPGAMEVGAIDFGIYLDSKKYIVIDGIDVFGPSSREDLRQIYLTSCDNVIVRNCVLSFHNKGGIMSKNGTSNCTYENIKSHDHMTTALYFWGAGAGNKIINCEAYNSGTVIGDGGDKGLIGVFDTPGVVIDSCYAHDNGNESIDHIDAAISIVQSPGVSVLRCIVKNAGGVGIMFAEESSSGLAAYNIVDGWGVFGKNILKNPYFAGIRLGGGSLTNSQQDCEIYNNLLINGTNISGEWGALGIMYSDHSGLTVKNNIFYNNSGTYEVHARSRTNFADWNFSHNIYYRSGGSAIFWQGDTYSFDRIIGEKSGFYSFDKNQDKNSIAIDPELTADMRNLEENSPCMNSGVWVGVTKDIYGNAVTKEDGVNIGPFNKKMNSLINPPTGINIDVVQ